MPRKYAVYGRLLKYYRELSSLKIHPPWSQARLAKALGVSPRTYAGWEIGETLPFPDDLKNFVAVLKLSEEEEKNLYRAVAQIPPAKKNLSPRNRLFTGREEYLDLVSNYFNTDTTVALSGLPGIGKTQLALEFAYCHHPNVYRVVLWVSADKAALQASYADLAEVLQLPERNERDLRKRIQAVKQWFEDHANWLLIMDYADDLELARDFFPAGDHCRILLTTRTQIVGSIARMIEIEAMEPEEGLDFLLRRSLPVDTPLDTISADTRESAHQVVELLGGHPLALDQAGAFIEDGGSFTTYIQLYDKQRRDLLDRRGSLKGADSDYPETVAVTFALCFDKARTQYPLADEILRFCAFLHPDAIPEELFHHDESFKYGTTVFIDGITALLRYSLLTRNMQENTFTIHRLVQAVLIDDMPDDLQKQERILVVRRVSSAFLDNFDSSDEWILNECLLPHILVCATWAYDELAWTPDVGAIVGWVFDLASSHLYEQGQVSEAEFLKARELLLYVECFGLEHPTTLSTMNELAVIYTNQDKDDKAEPLFHRIFATWIKILRAELSNMDEELLGQAVKGSSQSLFGLGLINMRQQKTEQAEQYLREALSIQMKYLGDEHPDTARSLYLLSFLDIMQGKFGPESESYAQQAIRIWENTEHPDSAVPIVAAAGIAELLGQYDLEEIFFQQALDIQERQLGAKHPEVQATKKIYADSLRKRGRDAEAAALELNDEPSV